MHEKNTKHRMSQTLWNRTTIDLVLSLGRGKCEVDLASWKVDTLPAQGRNEVYDYIAPRGFATFHTKLGPFTLPPCLRTTKYNHINLMYCSIIVSSAKKILSLEIYVYRYFCLTLNFMNKSFVNNFLTNNDR